MDTGRGSRTAVVTGVVTGAYSGATAARHRRAAFDAADFLMDWLKSRAPFWKREIGPDGPRGWVAAKDKDEAALHRW